jgi:hypothetical protein
MDLSIHFIIQDAKLPQTSFQFGFEGLKRSVLEMETRFGGGAGRCRAAGLTAWVGGTKGRRDVGVEQINPESLKSRRPQKFCRPVLAEIPIG